MTGKTATLWTWLPRIGVPASLVVAEATWASLLIGAAFYPAHGPRVDVPFLAVALAGVTAVTVGAAGVRLIRRRWRRAAVLIPLIVVGVALTAGTLSTLTSSSASWWQVATNPWSVSGHPAAVTAGAAWFVAIVAWARGIWVSLLPPSFRHTVWSLSLGAAAFVGIFAGRADHHAVAFHAATAGAGWLVFAWFPLIGGVISLVRQGDLEEEVLAQKGSGPVMVWLTVLALPMLGVALIALALAVIVGPGAPLAGHAVARGAGATGGAIAAAAKWLWDLLPRHHGSTRPGRPPSLAGRVPGGAPQVTSPHHGGFAIPAVIWDVLIAGLVVAALVFVRRNFPGLRFHWTAPETAVDEERDSVFTWRHLAAQLSRAVLALLARLRRRRQHHESNATTTQWQTGTDDAETVRGAYRRMLAAARRSGHGRGAAETTHEFEIRLTATLGPDAREALGQLTDVYDLVRYGQTDPAEPAPSQAARHAGSVATALEDTLATESS